MMPSTFLMLALAAVSASALPQSRNGDRVDGLLKGALKFAKPGVAMFDNKKCWYNLAYDYERSEFDGLIEADAFFTDIFCSGMSNFAVDYVKTDSERLAAKFGVNFPQLTLTSKYEISGHVAGESVIGRGQYKINTINATLSMDNLEMFETDKKALRIKSLGLNIHLNSLAFSVDGLTVNHMSLPDFEKLVDKSLLAYWNKIKQSTESDLERRAIEFLNQAIEDKTLEEATEWLNHTKPW